jgi:membrane associated rhomboid family serine protease
MRDVSEYSTATVFNDCFTSGATCSLETLCGFGGFSGSVPNQSFRFFTPIFIHAGIIHILMNLITHVQLGGQIERTLGLVRYIILYIGSGIFGFVLSGLLSGTSSRK